MAYIRLFKSNLVVYDAASEHHMHDGREHNAFESASAAVPQRRAGCYSDGPVKCCYLFWQRSIQRRYWYGAGPVGMEHGVGNMAGRGYYRLTGMCSSLPRVEALCGDAGPREERMPYVTI